MQQACNGTRTGKLSDFGGRREDGDRDAFETAARELCEETDYCFGSVPEVASSLRGSASVRIINRAGRYVCFFLKVGTSELQLDDLPPSVDTTADDSVMRDFRWWRADELLRGVDDNQILARMLAPSVRVPIADAIGADARSQTLSDHLSSFHRAVCKTVALEKAHPDAPEQWATVLATMEDEAALVDAMATASLPTAHSASTAPHRLESPRAHVPSKAAPPPLAKPQLAKELEEWAASVKRPSQREPGSAGLKRGSRRGPPKPPARVPWALEDEQRAAGRSYRPAAHKQRGVQKQRVRRRSTAASRGERREAAVELELGEAWP